MTCKTNEACYGDCEECRPEEPVVTEEDWDLGPACSVEHEECESCQ